MGFQQVSVTDVKGKATVFESNLAGQRKVMVDPNAGATFYAYDANGQSTSVTSPAGTITMGYDVLGRLTSRTTGGSSSATWDYVEPGDTGAAADLGLLRSSSSTTHTSLGDLTTQSQVAYDSLHRPVSSTVTLPSSPSGQPDLLGDLSGKTFTTTAGYDAIGQASTVGLPAVGGLPAETLTTGFRTSGVAQTLTVSSTGVSTPVVTGVSMSATGQMLQRSYGNDVKRNYSWDPVTRALVGLSASFVTSESGSAQTAYVQKDAFTRDVMGRIVTSTTEVPVSDGTTANGQATAECFTYDGFNRLSSVWTVADATTPACGGAAPADTLAAGWDASTTAYAATWGYSAGGRITSLVKGAGATATTSTYAYTDAAHPAAATSVTTGPGTDSFTYDGAGRTVSRTVAGVTTALTWDVTSSLTESNGQGGRVVYAYDTSGQRVLHARVADANGVGSASAYVASGQVDDPNTASTSTGDLSATRYYTFAGSTVAVRTNDNKLSLMLGDEQGSTNVMLPVATTVGGGMVAAALADASGVTRTSYTPYGELRGDDNLAVDRGWLGQTEDRIEGTGATSTGTGLTYLNARYYDPVLSRFLSPDPLMNPGDPRTLDPYVYSSNNPVTYSDSSGLRQDFDGTTAGNDRYWSDPKNKDVSTFTGVTKNGSAGGGLTGGTRSASAGGSSGVLSPSDILTILGGLNQLNGGGGGGLGSSLGGSPSVAVSGAWARNVFSGIFDPGSGNGGTCNTTFKCWTDQLKQMSEGSRRVLKELGLLGREAFLVMGDPGIRKLIAVLSHLEQFGPAFAILGVTASMIDSTYRLRDKGWDRDLNGIEQGAFVIVRTGWGELGGLGGSAFGASEGAAGGLVCLGGAIACSPALAAVLGIAGGAAGDAGGTYVFDRVADIVMPWYISVSPW